MNPNEVGRATSGISHGVSLCEWRLGMEPRQCKFPSGRRMVGASDMPFAVSDD